ncbi:MAG: transaldolase [Ignavibacteriaceae bacterium]
MANPLIELEKFGQSVWLDNISRGLLKKGELKALVENDGLRGVTSNPTIFQKAIGAGTDYDEQFNEIVKKNPNLTAYEIFVELAVKDIQDGADTLRPVYDKTNGQDGYISLEVAPDLAYDTEATINEARRLFKLVNRPNLMIKIPATTEGMPAIKQMISEGVNINVTLIFSQKFYEDVVEAYISGLEARAAKGENLDHVASVASFFISRIDSAVDKKLDAIKNTDLQAKIAIANAKLVYDKAKELFGSERFKKLAAKGAKVQRLLWASTSTKNPAYSDILYVEELIGKDTVNTLPPATVDAYRDHGKPASRIESNLDEAKAQMAKLKELGISFDEITKKLTEDGVKSFADSFTDLLNTIDRKKNELK